MPSTAAPTSRQPGDEPNLHAFFAPWGSEEQLQRCLEPLERQLRETQELLGAKESELVRLRRHVSTLEARLAQLEEKRTYAKPSSQASSTPGIAVASDESSRKTTPPRSRAASCADAATSPIRCSEFSREPAPPGPGVNKASHGTPVDKRPNKTSRSPQPRDSKPRSPQALGRAPKLPNTARSRSGSPPMRSTSVRHLRRQALHAQFFNGRPLPKFLVQLYPSTVHCHGIINSQRSPRARIVAHRQRRWQQYYDNYSTTHRIYRMH